MRTVERSALKPDDADTALAVADTQTAQLATRKGAPNQRTSLLKIYYPKLELAGADSMQRATLDAGPTLEAAQPTRQIRNSTGSMAPQSRTT